MGIPPHQDADVLQGNAAFYPWAGALRAILGDVPGSFLDIASIAASPASFVWARWLDRLESLGEPEALLIHFRVERCALDEFPLPARLFEEVVEWLSREDRFMRGNLTIAGRIAAPEALAMPLLSVDLIKDVCLQMRAEPFLAGKFVVSVVAIAALVSVEVVPDYPPPNAGGGKV